MASRNNIQKNHNSFGLRAGTAVAAALLLINGGIAYKVLSGSAKPDNMPAASSVVSVDAPVYVQRMQEYYAKMNDKPCDFDFSGMGEDISMTWESDEWKVELKAITGCDTLLYFFYDVTPKQGQTPDDLRNRWPGLNFSLDEDMGKAPRSLSNCSMMMSPEEGAAVYHGFGICWPADGFGLAGQDVMISAVSVNVGKDGILSSSKEDIIGTEDSPLTLDFIPELPVENLKEAFAYSVNEGETEHATGVKVSPFGLYFSDSFYDDIDRAYVQNFGGQNISSLAVKAVMKDGNELDIPLQNNTACNDFIYTDENGEEQIIKNIRVIFAEPVALYNVQCFVVSCDGTDTSCTIPVNPEVEAEDMKPSEKQEAEKTDADENISNLLRLDMTDAEYTALSEDEKFVYGVVKDIWMDDNGFKQFSGYVNGQRQYYSDAVFPQHSAEISDGDTVQCGNMLDTEYWVDVEQFEDLQRPCDARIRLMYNGNAVPVMVDPHERESERTGKFEIGEGTGFPMMFDLTEVPDGAVLTLEVYYTPEIELDDGRMNDITVLKTIAFTYEKWDENADATAAVDDLFAAVNCALTDMDAENLDLSLLEGSYYISADDRIGAAEIANPQTSDEMRKSLAYRLTECYHWDMLGAYQHIGVHVKDGVCDSVVLATRSGNTYTHATSPETNLEEFLQNAE